MKIQLQSFILLLLIATSCKTVPVESISDSGIKPIHPRIVWTENPSEHAIISWTTLFSNGSNVVHYDTVSHLGRKKKYAYHAEAIRSGKITIKAMDFTEGVPEGYYHHSELNGLKANTKYYFALESDGNYSDEYHFITAPDDDRPVKLIAGGDSRLGTEKPRYAGRTPHRDRQEINKMIARQIEKDPEILAIVQGADFGTTADWRHLYWWFEDYAFTYTIKNRILPMLVSMGNHDLQIGFFENFYLGDEINDIAFSYYYTSKITSEIALITLNTEIAITGPQYYWLEEQLALHRPQVRWLLVNYHKPSYPANKDPEDYRFKRVREAWVPLFEKYNIDLAIESDGHTLKRTVPIRDGKMHPEGITYIGEGGLGAPLREPDSTRWYIQKPGFAARAYHIWKISVKPESIIVEAIDLNENVIDSHLIKRN